MGEIKVPNPKGEKLVGLKLEGMQYVDQRHKELKGKEEKRKRLEQEAMKAEDKIKDEKLVDFIEARNRVLSKETEGKEIRLKATPPTDFKKAKKELQQKKARAHAKGNKKMRIVKFIPIAVLIGSIALAAGGSKEIPKPVVDTPIENPINNPDILNIIETKYNETITNPEKQIHQEDLTVVREFCGDGQVYEMDGKYYQDYLAGLEPTPEGVQWLEASEMKQVVAVLNEADSEHVTAVTALMEKSNGDVVPLTIETMTLDGKHAITKAEQYLELKNNPQYLRVIETELMRTRAEQQEKDETEIER